MKFNSIFLKRIIVMIFVSLSVGVVTSCATKYHSSGVGAFAWNEGYSELALKQDTYVVSFSGNNFTNEGTVQGYLLRRCAELSLSKGYKYFVVLDGKTSVKSTVGQTPTTVNVNSYGSYNGFGSSNTSFYGNNAYSHSNFMGNSFSNSQATINPGTQYQMDRYTSRVTIKMFKKNIPQALDAKVILSNFNDKQ